MVCRRGYLMAAACGGGPIAPRRFSGAEEQRVRHKCKGGLSAYRDGTTPGEQPGRWSRRGRCHRDRGIARAFAEKAQPENLAA